MALTPAAYPSVADPTTIEMSQEALRSILGQIETELYRSDIYQRAVASLQTLLGEAAQGTQILVQAVAREAIGLTLKHFKTERAISSSTQKDWEASVAQPNNPEWAVNIAPDGVVPRNDWENNPERAIESQWHCGEPGTTVEAAKWPLPASTAEPSHGSASQQKAQNASHARNSNKTDAAAIAQAAEQMRQERLRQVGQELRSARQARFLSLEQLQRQTLVSIAHLESLETGRLDRLPEDVYVRGFIRRIGDALGLNGTALAASIPAPDPVKSVVPSWAMPQPESGGGLYLRTGHLYLGYAALVVGAVGGLSWLSGQTVPGAVAEPDPGILSPAAVVQPEKPAEVTRKPELKSSHAGVPVWSDIAPPELQAY